MVAHRIHPKCKVEAGATDISTDSITVEVHRPLNAISFVKLTANDYEGKNYIANIDKWTVLKVSFAYGDDAYEKVFEGVTEAVGPSISRTQGQRLSLTAYGYGRALRETHCHVNFGAESENDTLDLPTEIWDDLVANRINKNFDGVNTGYALTDTKIVTLASPTIPFLKGGYRNNLEILNEVCLIYQAHQAGSAGVHWWVDPSKNLWIDSVGAHSVDTGTYPTYWKITEAASTLVEGKDFKQTDFSTNVRGFANKILLFTDLRKPGSDYLTEDSGGQAVWGTTGTGVLSDDNTAGKFIVGSHSLKADTTIGLLNFYYPSTQDADWDFTKIGSEKSIPTLNFYAMKNRVSGATGPWLRLYSGAHYFYIDYIANHITTSNEFIHLRYPLGPYYSLQDENRKFRWLKSGSPVWTDIDYIEFNIAYTGNNDILWFDDLHFSGKIIREAKDGTSIVAVHEHQKTVKMDVAVDDSMSKDVVTGTAAYLSYAELLSSLTTPITGQAICPLIIDLYPGQLVHIHSDYYGTNLYRVNLDFRCQEIIHNYHRGGASTTLNLTSDVKNTFGKSHDTSPSAQFAAYKKLLFTDPEAKNLKSGTIDELIPRLIHDYNP